MPVTDEHLDNVVRAWKAYAAARPDELRPRDLLEKRDLNMYRGLGIAGARELAERMVDDRSIATLEMTMGFLYERLLEELGPKKVAQAEKDQPGYKGIDFTQVTASELRVINLKAGLSTGNGDINTSTVNHLGVAKQHWESHPQGDDNPLRQHDRHVVMVRAVARGPRRQTTTDEGILWLVGDSMWEHFGAGGGLLARLGEALGRNPLDYDRRQQGKNRAVARTLEYLVRAGLATRDGQINWSELVARFP